MVLNNKTEVKEIPDQGKRLFCFEVICGKTGKCFEISADDEKSRHEWILAIKKVCVLPRVHNKGRDETMRECRTCYSCVQ